MLTVCLLNWNLNIPIHLITTFDIRNTQTCRCLYMVLVVVCVYVYVCVISKLPFSFGFCNINVMILFRIQGIRSYCIDRVWTRQRQWRESMRFSRLLNACKISLKLMKWIYWLHIVKKTAPNRITGATV